MNLLARRPRTAAHRLAALLVLSLAACQTPTSGPDGGDIPELAADRVMIDMEHFSTADGIRRARLHADTALFFSDSAAVHLRGMDIDMFEVNGAKNGSITARSGVLNTQTRAMIARGNVVLVTVQQGQRIETEELNYDPSTHRVWSNSRTVITSRDGSRQIADSFETDDKFSSVNARGARGPTGITF